MASQPPALPSDGPLEFFDRLLAAIDQQIERGGHRGQGLTAVGMSLLVKRAAMAAGVRGAVNLRMLTPRDPQQAAELCDDVDQVLLAIGAAHERCDRLWIRWGYPEAHAAALQLAGAHDALLPSDRLAPTLPPSRRSWGNTRG
jgi:hypothetical protein